MTARSTVQFALSALFCADVQLPADIKPGNSFQSHRAAGAEQTEAPPTRVAVLRTPAVGVPVRTFNRDGTITHHE